MRKLIRSKVTKKFLAENGDWIDDIKQARCFDDLEEMQHAKKTLNLTGSEIYHSFDPERKTRHDFTLPL